MPHLIYRNPQYSSTRFLTYWFGTEHSVNLSVDEKQRHFCAFHKQANRLLQQLLKNEIQKQCINIGFDTIFFYSAIKLQR